MGRSRRHEESVQPDRPLSHSPQGSRSRSYDSWDRCQGENGLRDAVPDEEDPPSPPVICPSRRVMPENPSDPNPNPRTHRRKKNIEHIITLSTIISTHLKNWPHVALYAIIATIVVVYVYKYDIIASIVLSTIFTATPLILHITFPSSQIFSKVRRNRRKNDLLEEINTRTEENADDRRIGYNSFGPQHSSQELPREEIQVKAFDSAPAYYDTAIVEPRSSQIGRAHV